MLTNEGLGGVLQLNNKTFWFNFCISPIRDAKVVNSLIPYDVFFWLKSFPVSQPFPVKHHVIEVPYTLFQVLNTTYRGS